ncbi:MAG: hypothetical protein M3N16_01430 [Actinomycetota bacterium]|nr:hypothetical protein [Actinomycetota bacterium]
MDDRELARQFALGRVALAAAMLVLPGAFAGAWVGADGRRPGARVIMRGFAARDLAIGLGLRLALDRGRPARGWVEAGILADAADFAATLTGRRLPALGRLGTLALAGGATALGAKLAGSVDEARAEGAGAAGPSGAL